MAQAHSCLQNTFVVAITSGITSHQIPLVMQEHTTEKKKKPIPIQY
jgi:hypothetical protein